MHRTAFSRRLRIATVSSIVLAAQHVVGCVCQHVAMTMFGQESSKLCISLHPASPVNTAPFAHAAFRACVRTQFLIIGQRCGLKIRGGAGWAWLHERAELLTGTSLCSFDRLSLGSEF